MKIIVTGGAGFIGSNFVHHLVTNYPEYNITVVDKLTYAGNKENLKPITSKVNFIQADICDKSAYSEVTQTADYVVHFAAESHNTRAEKNPDIFWQTNVEGTRTVLDLLTTNSNLKKFVHISTDEVYGEIPEGIDCKEEDKKSGDFQATSDYSKSKSIADDLAHEYMDKIPINIIRPTNNFGPYQHPEKLFPRSITRILTGQATVLWGEGNEIRDWLYAPDDARAIDLVMHKASAGEIYNVAANHSPEIRNRDLIHWLMGRLYENNARIQHTPNPRPAHDFRYGLNDSKLRNELGWRPGEDVWEQFEKTLQWYKKNEGWWKPLLKEAESIYE